MYHIGTVGARGGRGMWTKYQNYIEWFEMEQDRGFIDEDEEPEDYDDFCWNYEEWNRDDCIEKYL